MHRFFLISAAFTCLALPERATAQARDTSKGPAATLQADTPACCSIVRIDAERAMVTARETATGFTFRFAIKPKRQLLNLKIGQPVWADFASKTVKLKATDAQPCCAIVDTQEKP